MARVGADGLLYGEFQVRGTLFARRATERSTCTSSGPHKPGDDNFHNPLTNIDFRVTPPVRESQEWTFFRI
jgi:hypothetical protein